MPKKEEKKWVWPQNAIKNKNTSEYGQEMP